MYLVISKNKTHKNCYGLLSDDSYLVNNNKFSSVNNRESDKKDNVCILVPKINTLSKNYIPFEKWKEENEFYIYMLTNDIIKQINAIKLDDMVIYINDEGIEENISKMLYKLSNNRFK